ncbi:unnamed protein product [Penicillium olsonii]|uniref:RNase III domain-containing protein n=1 Tax=Penicillium olsonii TaxID=99116 RepID=A0A9W4HAV7_PENOL|nr:unnamed protein product [Penicillium olsonii]CAG7952239.1 unnamed protein product [Penicillium olsonii]CAG8065174.1 unnamed protein product [Penicillium olsonii]CAG8207000.1 unnamed protein product [Penicillium olsonii]
MALNLSSRAARSARAASKLTARPIATVLPSRTYATSPEENNQDKPRWSYTPAQAKAPFSLHLHSKRPAFHVNSDPALLDRFYIRLFGNGGDQILSDETKWLAVTHKSFDQGRRGFNDRLAFLGKRIVQLQASLALAQSVPAASGAPEAKKDEFGRVPFTHAALDGLSNLSAENKNVLTERSKLAELGQKYDLHKVVRWSPRKPDDLRASGIDLVLSHTLYAIIGAVSLEKGGVVAAQIARERILDPLGLKSLQ